MKNQAIAIDMIKYEPAESFESTLLITFFVTLVAETVLKGLPIDILGGGPWFLCLNNLFMLHNN